MNQTSKSDLFSIKMRAAQGAAHELGGRHISGEERILPQENILACMQEMLTRAFSHQRGAADFINIKVERILPEQAMRVPMLAFSECHAQTVAEGRDVALQELVRAGVTPQAAAKGIAAIAGLADSMRGAMLVNAVTGERMDATGARGVRVTGMDVEDPVAFKRALAARGLQGDHVREALVLASKVASGKGVVAELCWSDDPLYVTGYVGSPRYGYRRIPVLKERMDPVGGRVFFVRPDTDVAALTQYYENQIVFITAGVEGYVTAQN